MLETDSWGNLVWEDGLPKSSEQHKRKMTEFFTPSATFKYTSTSTGEKKSYSYARHRLGANGAFYVPVAMKHDGSIAMVEEDRYREILGEFLPQTGVSPFDNFTPQDRVYPTVSKFSQAAESRLRGWTDTVSATSLGGRELTPKDLKGIAMVDTEMFQQPDGKNLIDGTALVMPGLLPARAAVVRMGYGAIKGQMQQIDIHQLLRKMTGNQDLREFYMPTQTAPEEVKEFVKRHFSSNPDGAYRTLKDTY